MELCFQDKYANALYAAIKKNNVSFSDEEQERDKYFRKVQASEFIDEK